MSRAILSLNAGSSSIKFALYDVAGIDSGERLPMGRSKASAARRISSPAAPTARH